LFTKAAKKRIAEVSAGVPRSINILCEMALIYGFAGEVKLIGLKLVNDVVKDRGTYGLFGNVT